MMGSLMFWLLRVAWIATLLPWAFFAFGTMITHSDDNFILWYPVAILALIVPTERLRRFGYQKTAWVIGVTPLLLVSFILYSLFFGPIAGFRDVPKEGPYAEYYDSGQSRVEGTWALPAATNSTHKHTDRQRPRGAGAGEHVANDGPRTTWYPSGQKLSEGDFIDGEETGTWTTWYESGERNPGQFVQLSNH